MLALNVALNDKQKAFVREYLVDLNATAAYQRAGYRANGEAARRAASRLLTNVDVQAAIAEAQAQRAQRVEITADRVVQEIARLALSDMRQLVGWGPGRVDLLDSASISDDAAACVSEVSQTVTQTGGTVKIKLHSKPQALRLLGDHLGIFKERQPLEVLLAALPAELAGALRQELARLVSGGTNPPGGGSGQAGAASG